MNPSTCCVHGNIAIDPSAPGTPGTATATSGSATGAPGAADSSFASAGAGTPLRTPTPTHAEPGQTVMAHPPAPLHFGAISYPIYQTATFAHPGVGQSTGYDYTRQQNPTRDELERVVRDLEHGTDALAFATGMAAAGALMELFSPGDHIVASEDLYGGSIRLFAHINRKNGISVTHVDTGDIAAVEGALGPDTRAIFVETPTNPMMHVTDIRKVADLAHSRGLLLIVDNTFMTPIFQTPLTLGADVVLHSGTKYLGGHNDTLSGFLVVKSPELSEKLRFIFKTTGAGLAPFDSWLILRGLKTLDLRVRRQEQNALAVATWLKAQPKVTKVFYPGLPEHPGYAVSKAQCHGFGAMISFLVDSEETAKSVLNRVRLIRFAESLGGVESLITYPLTQTHADLSPAEREHRGISGLLLRFSAGIEAAGDLLADLAQALG